MTYPHVRVEGGPRDRGRSYGEQARERVRLSLDAYASVFQHYTGWDWPKATAEALRFENAIAEYEPRCLEEMRGLAEGAGVEYRDILALNVRTEVIFAAKARQAREEMRQQGECSAFASLPAASAEGHTLVGQNWDWRLHSFDTVVVLEARQDEGPDFVTVVEAGLLAKTGMNSSGIGVATNALVTDDDVGAPDVPYHVVLRALLDSETIPDALAAVQRRPRSSSANYLIAHEDGIAVDIEAAPGDFSRLFLLFPENGILLHTNHFRSPAFDGKDVSLWAMPDSPFRLERLQTLVRDAGPGVSLETFQVALADHASYPLGICCHPDERLDLHEQGATVASVVMDLDARTLWLADGHPCSTPYRELDYGEFLSKPSPVRPRRRAGIVRQPRRLVEDNRIRERPANVDSRAHRQCHRPKSLRQLQPGQVLRRRAVLTRDHPLLCSRHPNGIGPLFGVSRRSRRPPRRPRLSANAFGVSANNTGERCVSKRGIWAFPPRPCPTSRTVAAASRFGDFNASRTISGFASPTCWLSPTGRTAPSSPWRSSATRPWTCPLYSAARASTTSCSAGRIATRSNPASSPSSPAEPSRTT